MNEAWCDLCDLPLDTCVHGRPPTPPPPPPVKAATPRKRAASTTPRATSKAAAQPRASVRRAEVRRTRQAAFRPHILAALQDHGGSCEAEVLLTDVHERMAEVLLDGDHDTIGRHEPRWQYSARFERKAMTEDGLMQPARTPGVWELTPEGLEA